MRVRSYRSIAADEHVPEEAAERYRTAEGLRQAARRRLHRGGRSRTARDQPAHAAPVAVLDVRRKYPFMDKARIQAVLARKGHHLSVSTVGRIIERALEAGAIRPASYCEGRVKPKRRRALPFPLLSIQVDGGSEFMADFEEACEELGVPLHVLPPRRS